MFIKIRKYILKHYIVFLLSGVNFKRFGVKGYNGKAENFNYKIAEV